MTYFKDLAIGEVFNVLGDDRLFRKTGEHEMVLVFTAKTLYCHRMVAVEPLF